MVRRCLHSRQFLQLKTLTVLVLLMQCLTASGLPVSVPNTAGCSCSQTPGAICRCRSGACGRPPINRSEVIVGKAVAPSSCCKQQSNAIRPACSGCGSTGPRCCCCSATSCDRTEDTAADLGAVGAFPDKESTWEWIRSLTITPAECQGKPTQPPGFCSLSLVCRPRVLPSWRESILFPGSSSLRKRLRI